jgi:glycosyltransferase involved in cell wall biosynthesis
MFVEKRPMRLGIDAKALHGVRTGIGNWTFFLLRELPRFLPGLQVIGYLASGSIPIWPASLEDPLIRSNRRYPLKPGYFWLKLHAARMVIEDDLDVFWAPRTLYPAGLAGIVPVVSVIYDLNSALHPGTMPIANLLAHKLWFRGDLLAATRIVSVSWGTSRRLKDWLGREADAIVPPGVDPCFCPQADEVVVSLRQRYGLERPYLLFVGTLEPRKNLEQLLAAHRRLNSALREPMTLVLVGQRGWRNSSLARRLDVGLPHVKELGFVPNEDLPGLYSGAEVFVMPSLYEGYGIPAAEAIACGTHVVATDIPELREAAGPEAIYVEPTVESIFDGVRVAMKRPQPIPKQSKTWQDSAAVLAGALREAAASR